MSEEQAAEKSKDLQFDKAAFKDKPAGGSGCQICNKPLPGSYYNINGAVACPECKISLETQFTGGHAGGRLGKALLFGIPAALAGTAIYYAIMAMTGYEFGLVAILIGWMVGKAVHKGSGGRGGRGYQILAVLLTYISICSTYIPGIIGELSATYKEGEAKPEEQSFLLPGESIAEAQEVLTDEDINRIANQPPAADALSNVPAEGSTVDAPVVSAPADENVTFLEFMLGWGIIFAIALAAPFLAGFGNIIGWVIIGIGLWQAWIMNKKVILNIQGPFDVKAAG